MKTKTSEINYEAVEQTICNGYRAITPQYRRDDEIEVTTQHHRHVRATIQRLCASFPHPIRVLDLGCGTGRYFHCVRNAKEIIGVDISDDMLMAARQPVKADEITVPEIRLIRSNAYRVSFPPGSFHLIYSLGMFGNGCPVTPEICDKFHDWLFPGGKLFFNTVDVAGLPLMYRARRQARGLVYPLLTRHLKNRLDEREARHPFFGLTRHGLEEILAESRFTDFQVQSRPCESPLWAGRHLECIATRSV